MMSAFTFALIDIQLLLLLVIIIVSTARVVTAVVAVTVGIFKVSQQPPGCCQTERLGR